MPRRYGNASELFWSYTSIDKQIEQARAEVRRLEAEKAEIGGQVAELLDAHPAGITAYGKLFTVDASGVSVAPEPTDVYGIQGPIPREPEPDPLESSDVDAVTADATP